jgi:DNA-binding XRE family transcriptional regulator
MKTNKEKFLELVSGKDQNISKEIKQRIAQRAMLRASQHIALRILERLEELKWTQKEFALKMGVTPQYVNKILKGKENFTLETLVLLQSTLDIPIMIPYFDEKKKIDDNNTTKIM